MVMRPHCIPTPKRGLLFTCIRGVMRCVFTLRTVSNSVPTLCKTIPAFFRMKHAEKQRLHARSGVVIQRLPCFGRLRCARCIRSMYFYAFIPKRARSKGRTSQLRIRVALAARLRSSPIGRRKRYDPVKA